MKNSRVPFLNTYYDNFTMGETVDEVEKAIGENRQIHHTVINANKVVMLQKNQYLRESVNEADIINIDGKAILWAARFLNKPAKERVAGIDLMSEMLRTAEKKGFGVYLFGAKEEVIVSLTDRLNEQYPRLKICGTRNGYFEQEDEKGIVFDIAESGAQLLFVGMPSPRKENFLYEYREELSKVNFIMGVGGSFDVLSGKVKRAPVWMQNAGMEWFYRFLQEPGRMWKRYLVGNSKFIFLVLKEKFARKR